MFFGGGGGGRGFAQEERRPKDLVHELPMTLEELYKGKTRRIRITRHRLCSTCNGVGVKPNARKNVCATCSGRGMTISVQQAFPGFLQQVQTTCTRCGGTGEYVRPSDICTKCHGKCIVDEKKELDVHVEQGALKNDVINLTGEGD
uniref:DnaJ subfamily A member 4 n=1 Tax=Lygus hesperus TaxID=30085 RepID=A0A0A9WGP8_LYGHE